MNRGGMDVKYFKWKDRYYVVQSFEFSQGPNNDLGAVVFDVTGLPDPEAVKEVARLRLPAFPGGFHNIFIYKHSNGRPLLLTTVRTGKAHVYDLGLVVEGRAEEALISEIPLPEVPGRSSRTTSYHDLYAAWHPDTGEDRFYGGGTGGYYIFDITDLENPKLKITLTGISGVDWGHTFTPSPDGRYVVGEAEYENAPLRIFDLKPALDGEAQNIRSPISAWTADWKNLVHNHEVRWPYVFVSGYMDGLQVFSLMDPKNPQNRGILRYLPRSAHRRLRGSDQWRLWCRRTQRRRPDRHLRYDHRILDLPHGWVQRMERRRLGLPEHFERAGLGIGAGGNATVSWERSPAASYWFLCPCFSAKCLIRAGQEKIYFSSG